MGHLQELGGLYGVVRGELGINQLRVHVSDDGVLLLRHHEAVVAGTLTVTRSLMASRL